MNETLNLDTNFIYSGKSVRNLNACRPKLNHLIYLHFGRVTRFAFVFTVFYGNKAKDQETYPKSRSDAVIKFETAAGKKPSRMHSEAEQFLG